MCAGDPEEIKRVQLQTFIKQVFRALCIVGSWHVLQLELAKRYDLPVNVHSCCAGHYAIEILKQQQVCERLKSLVTFSKASRVLLHAFDGKAQHAEAAYKAGYILSVPACIGRSPQLQKMVRRVPLEGLVLETDSPALGPEKGVVNTPGNLCVSAEEIAVIKGISLPEVVTITTTTAKALWHRP